MASEIIIAIVLHVGRLIVEAIAAGRDDKTSTDEALREIDALRDKHRAEYERIRDGGA